MSQVEKGTVLIVDDESEIREIIAMNVAPLGFHVLEAADGGQAMEVVQKHAVDVILSDLMMPRVSGLSLLNRLREGGFMQPFIFLTAYPSQDSTLHALRLGAFDYLEKPFDAEELKTLLREAMRVGLEMKKLGVDKNAAVPQPVVTQATSEIQRLRTLRYSEDEVSTKRGDGQSKIHEMFIAEATPQLLFCEAAIKGLNNHDDRAFELGYLFRVMQAIGNAAEAISASGIADLARAAEKFYTSLRVRPRAVNDGIIELAKQTNGALQEAVTGLGRAVRDAEAHSAEMVTALDKATMDLEAGRALKAG